MQQISPRLVLLLNLVLMMDRAEEFRYDIRLELSLIRKMRFRSRYLVPSGEVRRNLGLLLEGVGFSGRAKDGMYVSDERERSGDGTVHFVRSLVAL
jgi:hypothetical protein